MNNFLEKFEKFTQVGKFSTFSELGKQKFYNIKMHIRDGFQKKKVNGIFH